MALDLRKEILELSNCYLATNQDKLRIHLCLNWEGLLKIILWTDFLAFPLIARALNSAGVKDAELKGIMEADPLTLFHWLYYGRNYKVLRRLCAIAKNSVEGRVKGVRFECHLIAEEISKIVASTL